MNKKCHVKVTASFFQRQTDSGVGVGTAPILPYRSHETQADCFSVDLPTTLVLLPLCWCAFLSLPTCPTRFLPSARVI